MASYKIVKEELNNFINGDIGGEGHVLAISGGWGCGKTHLCQDVLKESSRNIYVSLFGLGSIGSVKQEICIGAGATDVAKLKKVSDSLGGKGNILSLGADMYNSVIFKNLQKKVIVLDDLERTNLNMLDIIGLISTLKEQKKCKVIIIFNSEKMGDKEKCWNEYKEKIIDTHIRLAPSSKEVSAVIFRNVNGEGYNKIEKFCNELNVTNIRTIKKILYRAKILQDHLKDIGEYGDEVLDLAYSHLVFYSHKDDEPEFRQYDKNSFNTDSTITKKGIIKEKIKLKDLNPENVGFHPKIVLSKKIIFLIEEGHLEEDKIENAVKDAIKYFDDRSKSKVFHDVWVEGVHGSFDSNEEDVFEALYTATINNISNLSCSDIDNVIGLFEEHDNCNDKVEGILKIYRDEVMVDDASIKQFMSRGNVLYDIKSKKLYGYLRELEKEAFEYFEGEKTLKSVILSMETNGWHTEDELYLSEATEEDYLNLFKTTRDKDLLHVSRVLRNFVTLNSGSEAQNKIKTTMTEALHEIGRKTPLNKYRIARFGIYKLPEGY